MVKHQFLKLIMWVQLPPLILLTLLMFFLKNIIFFKDTLLVYFENTLGLNHFNKKNKKKNKKVRRRILNSKFYSFNKRIDALYIYVYSLFFSLKYSLFTTPRLFYRVSSTKISYFDFSYFDFNYYLSGIISIWSSIAY